MKALRRRLRPLAIVLLGVFLTSCAGKKPLTHKKPHPFENGHLPAVIALLGHPDQSAVSGLRECFSRYEGIRLLADNAIYAELRQQKMNIEQLMTARNAEDLPNLSQIHYLLLLDHGGEQPLLHAYQAGEKKLRRFRVERMPKKCEKLLTTLGFFRISSDPPKVDAWADSRYLGQTPIYTPLTEGKHVLELFHPQHVFEKKTVFLPADEEMHFMRQNVQGLDADDKQYEGDKEPGKMGMWMMTIGGIIIGAGLIFLPIWLFVL